MSSEIPKPASPLPWYEASDNERLRRCCGSIVNKRHDIAEVTVIGSTNKREVVTVDDAAANARYIVWAANNAPKLAARIEQLEAALREIANSQGCIGPFTQFFVSDLDSEPMELARDIARKALE